MIAQAYYNDNPKTIRIFKNRNSEMIAELPLEEANDKSVNESLKRMGLRRTTKWENTSWGKEAHIRFLSR